MTNRLMGCLVATCLMSARVGSAQDTTQSGRAFVPLVALGASAWLVSPVDVRVAQAVRRPEWVRTGFVHDAAEGLSFMGAVTPIVAAGTWAYGSLKHNANALATGRTATQSLLAASLITGGLKYTLGRARPYVTADSNSRDFKRGRGWHNDDFRSLPSGHATVAFAFAAILSEEHARLNGRSSFVSAAAYTSAAFIGLSRIVLDKHWASDVLLGAGIGVSSGLITFRLAH